MVLWFNWKDVHLYQFSLILMFWWLELILHLLRWPCVILQWFFLSFDWNDVWNILILHLMFLLFMYIWIGTMECFGSCPTSELISYFHWKSKFLNWLITSIISEDLLNWNKLPLDCLWGVYLGYLDCCIKT